MQSLASGGLALLVGLVVCGFSARLPAEDQELTKRQKEIVAGIVHYAPWDCPDRWLYELGDVTMRNGALRRAMLEAASWVDFLALGNALDWSRTEAEKTHDFLMKQFPQVASGKVRQNILFLIALTADDAKVRLEPVFRGASGDTTEDDRADAGCALAALGHEKATAWLVEGLKTTDVFSGKAMFNFSDYRKAESEEKDRAAVRSYRFWEAVFRRPYFKPLQFLARAGIYRMTAHGLSDAQRDERASRLLTVFLSKWHGHPGSDDIAMRMMNFAVQKRDMKSIYLWAQRASLLPDQDCAGNAVHVLTALADSQLSTPELDEILQSEDGKQNREFLLYERFIKTARKELAAGLAYFDQIAQDNPGSVFALARRSAAKVAPSNALRDGLLQDLSLKIMLDYPKRSKQLGETPYEPEDEVTEDEYLGLLTSREREIVLRTRLKRRSSVDVDAAGLARQYRLLLELRNLVQMEEREKDPAVKADLRYRQAKLFYRESRALFPLWEREILNAGYRLNAVRFDPKADERLEEYAAETFSLRRAYVHLDSMLKEFPEYEGRDLVLFHMGHCFAKLMDYRPAKAVGVWTLPDRKAPDSQEGEIEYAHRRVAQIFQQLLDEHPESDWAAKVEGAAKWHAKMANLLRTKRDKEKRGDPRPKGPGKTLKL